MQLRVNDNRVAQMLKDIDFGGQAFTDAREFNMLWTYAQHQLSRRLAFY